MADSQQHHPRTPQRTVTLLVLCAAIPAGSAWAFNGGIVFDPSNFLENVRQAVALVQQVTRATTQIGLLRRMRTALPATVADGLDRAARDLSSQLNATSDAASANVLYPIDHTGEQPAWLDDTAILWIEAERGALGREHALASHVQREMAPTTQRIAILVQASNGKGQNAASRPGVTATLQAQEELLALCSGELDKLLGLRSLRARRRTMAQARRQSASAYHKARRNLLMVDWDPRVATSVRPISPPFGGQE